MIETPQGMMTHINAQFITGVAKIENRLVILISLADILSADEKKHAAKMAEDKI